MKIIIINGYAGVGKDTFVDYCRDVTNTGPYPYSSVYTSVVHNLSTISPIKALAEEIGWDGGKTPKDRKFLSDLKDLLSKYNDYSFNKTIENVGAIVRFFKIFIPHNLDKLTIFIHCREPEEIERFKKELGARSLIVRRHSSEVVTQFNHADNNVFDAVYDYTIFNEGSLDDLKESAKKFMEKINSEDWESHIDLEGKWNITLTT